MGTKNNCVHARLGQILTKRYKDQKTQLPLLKGLEQKRGWEQSRVLSAPALAVITKGWAGYSKPPSSQTPRHTPTSPHEGTSLPPHHSGGPSEALPGFLVWPLIIIHYSGKAENPGW